MSCAESSPVTMRSRSSGRLIHVATSGRLSTNRWSATSHRRQSPLGYVGEIGRARYGTGFAGSDTYSVYVLPAAGASHGRTPFGCKYSLLASDGGGQAGYVFQAFEPVWKVHAFHGNLSPLPWSQ